MKTMIAAGGTGGHIYPALAVAQRLKKDGNTIIWGGSLQRMEQDIALKEGFDFRGFDIRRPFEGFFWIFKDAAAFIKVLSLMKKARVNRVICAGGYISFFFASAARLLNIPYYLLEQNVIPGKVTRRMAKKAKKVFISFEKTKKILAGDNTVVTGNPVREKILNIELKGGCLTVLGGSLGARAINKAVLKLANKGFFREQGFKVLWITGKRDYKMIMDDLQQKDGIDVFSYRDDMENVYCYTDVVISRAGATALAEFFALGIPGVLIPYPYAKDDHQTENARCAAEKGPYIMIKESSGFSEELEKAVIGIKMIRTVKTKKGKRVSAAGKIVEELK